MKKNLGNLDRVMRTLGASAMLAGAALAPWAMELRLGLAASAVYLLFTASAGRCFGYAMMGRSTCSPLSERSR